MIVVVLVAPAPIWAVSVTTVLELTAVVVTVKACAASPLGTVTGELTLATVALSLDTVTATPEGPAEPVR